MTTILILLFTICQLSNAIEYENCGGSPLSDFCETITWQYNHSCSYIANKYNLTIHELVDYNWPISEYLSYLDNYYCSMFTEGDQICISQPDYSDCGAYPICIFEHPEYFCDSYTLEKDYITCEEICEIYNITMEEFKDWNRHNELTLQCWNSYWMKEGNTYCVSKPNITDFTDCVSIAEAENNPTNAEFYESLENESIGPLHVHPSSTGSSPDHSANPTAKVEYRNCGGLPKSDFCQTITWHDNYNCSYIARRFGLTSNELVGFNWDVDSDLYYTVATYCLMFIDGDEVCVTKPDYSDCGAYPFCLFEYPEYFCESYTLEEDYMTCEEICDMYSISVQDFKEWNAHNNLELTCGADYYMYEGNTYCISKPNITDFTDCVSIAEAENNPSRVSYYESLESETVGPLHTRKTSTSTITSGASGTSSAEVEYENCGDLPLSDFCQTITWKYNYNCSLIATKYNLTINELVRFNWEVDEYLDYLDLYYCSMFTEGDQVCVTRPDYTGCGTYPLCVFDHPEYFCDSYTLDKDYVTCQEICAKYNITLREFKEWNKHNNLKLKCWNQKWMEEGDTFCVSKPNITDFTDCVSIAVAEHNPANVNLYEDYFDVSIRPLSTLSTSRYSTSSSKTISSSATESGSADNKYANCGGSPLSDFCETITWRYNDTCDSVAIRYNLTRSELVFFNWVVRDYQYYLYYSYPGDHLDIFYCALFTEGDQVCVTEPDYSECGDYPVCIFEYPEYFCDVYIPDSWNIDCYHVCKMYNITLEEFKEWNKHNEWKPSCWDRSSMRDGESYCVSKPNITDFTDCVSIAAAEHNALNVASYESLSMETIGPLYTLSLYNHSTFTTSATESISATSTSETEYKNCGISPLSDICEVIIWQSNDTCASVAKKYNLTVDELVLFNWGHNAIMELFEVLYCDGVTEGDHVCITEPDYSECGYFGSCNFQNPVFFCDSYMADRDNITCKEISVMHNITMEDFKEWNKFNDVSLRCWDEGWISKYDSFCVSKPNITDFADCFSIALADHDPWGAELYETSSLENFRPLIPVTTKISNSAASFTSTSTRDD